MDTRDTFAFSYPSDCSVQITRQFPVPREKVFAAFASCDDLAQWLGPRTRTMSGCTIDFQTGGAYRYALVGNDGSAPFFFGQFQEIEAPSRIVQTFCMEGARVEPSTDTFTFTERDGVTTMVVTSQYRSREARDAMAQPGMEDGLRDSFNRLEALLAAQNR